MRFLICGLGSIGRRHLQNLRALGQEDIVLLRSGKSTLPNDDLIDLPVEGEIERALARFKPNAVIVSNPTALHLDVAIPAAKAGCHLLIEKPVSHNMNRIDELKEAVNRSRARALVGFQFRFHPGLGEVKRLLGRGVIGEPLSARAHWGEYLPAWHPWEDYRRSYAARGDLGGGVILTLCHPFDYLRWLLGDARVTHADAVRSGYLDLDVEDVAEIDLIFESGVQGHIHLDYLGKQPDHHVEVSGTRGSICCSATEASVEIVLDSGGKRRLRPAHRFERNDMFLEEMRHFISVVRGEAEPVCTLHDGIEALRLALAAYASSKASRSPAPQTTIPAGGPVQA